MMEEEEERQQDSPVQAKIEGEDLVQQLRRSVSLNAMMKPGPTSVPKANYLSILGEEQMLTDKNKQQVASKVDIVIDKLTLKRNTLYDKAKLKVYLDQCRIHKKKAQFDTIQAAEDELRFTIQELHDQELASEYENREKLMQKVIHLQNENTFLAQKLAFLDTSNSHQHSLANATESNKSFQKPEANLVFSASPLKERLMLIKENEGSENLKLACLPFLQSLENTFTSRQQFQMTQLTQHSDLLLSEVLEEEKLQLAKHYFSNEVGEVNEYNYQLWDPKIQVQEETVDVERGEGKEGEINKLLFFSVGSMAQLKHPSKFWPRCTLQV